MTTTARYRADILVVDDTPLNLQLLMQMLKHAGYNVRPALSGTEALQAVAEQVPDLILLDIMMSGMDGYEVADRLKLQADTQDIPIIFISALADVKSKVKAFTAGGVDYVTKPLRVEEVLARVETHIKICDLNRRLREELTTKESLIQELDNANSALAAEITERRTAQTLLQQTLNRTEALYEITRSLNAQNDFYAMLQDVAEGVTKVLPADYSRITIVDQETKEILHYIHRAKTNSKEIPPTYDEFMEGLGGWVVRNVQPVISPKELPDPRESHQSRARRLKYGYGAILVLPLYYMGKVLGTLTAINYDDKQDFDRQDLVVLSALATQVAVAVNNAQLTVETQKLKVFNESIVQGVAEAILITDMDGLISFANPAAASMLQTQADQLIDQNIGHLVVDEEKSRVLETIELCRTQPSIHYETHLQRANGPAIPVLSSTTAMMPDGQYTGALTAFTDITELKLAEEALRRYARDLEQRNAELDAFAHTVAHDLKNPLTALSGFSALILDRGDGLERKAIMRNIHYIAKSAELMNNIVDELLLLASVRKMDDIRLSELNMPKLLKQARQRLAYMISESGAEVCMAEEWPQALGYSPWVTEVWVNYLSNAVKYGGNPADGVTSCIEVGWDEQTDKGHLRFWVKDKGKGLTQEEQDQLFTPFERLHNVRIEGHGLGLSIVKRIIEKLNGKVGVESTVGEGSCFYFTLPKIPA